MSDTQSVALTLDLYSPGDRHSWAEEFLWLLQNHHEKVVDLCLDIASNGVREPISLGNDGRIWDGHHRLLCCRVLGIREVPVRWMPEAVRP